MASKATIENVRETDAALARVPERIAANAKASDAKTGGDIARDMRARVPVDSGNLLSGITESQEGSTTTVQATAVREGFDYARVIEFGREPAVNGGEDSGSDAEPFFFPAVAAHLDGREPALDGIVDRAGKAEGFGR